VGPIVKNQCRSNGRCDPRTQVQLNPVAGAREPAGGGLPDPAQLHEVKLELERELGPHGRPGPGQHGASPPAGVATISNMYCSHIPYLYT
jgi:hypothetical protein